MVDTRDLKSLARKGVLVRVQFRAFKGDPVPPKNPLPKGINPLWTPIPKLRLS
jgi:hypothetical protein